MPEVRKTSAGAVLAAWLIVGVPAAWGVYKTVRNAEKLFTTPAVPAQSATITTK